MQLVKCDILSHIPITNHIGYNDVALINGADEALTPTYLGDVHWHISAISTTPI